jgi:hypothetical protein
MVDYVWICKDGENEELRYSIRSVIKNMPKGNIWVVGGKPDWYVGNHIPVKQNLPKMRNAINNLMHICESDAISNNFILMNDDFFVIRPVKTVEHFNGGLLLNKIYQYEDLQPTSSYTRSLQETHDKLLKLGIKDPLDYELHVPMPMTKDGLKTALKNNSLFRSTYGNLYSVGGKTIKDVKVYSSKPLSLKSYDYIGMEYDYISSDDESFNIILNRVLLKMFTKPSLCEK